MLKRLATQNNDTLSNHQSGKCMRQLWQFPDKQGVLLLLSLIAFSCLMRLSVPPLFGHLPNFSPIAAIAVFSGWLDRRAWSAFVMTFSCILVSDLVVNHVLYHQLAVFYAGCYWQYSAYFLMCCLSLYSKARINALCIAYSALWSAIVFYIISNFGVWLTGGLYSLSLNGLLTCYIAAIPFFKHSLASNLVFMSMLYAGYSMVSITNKAAPVKRSL